MVNEKWGLKSELFQLGKYSIQSYPVFMFLGLIIGVYIYLIQLKKDNIKDSNALYIALFGISGGVIGAKLPIIFIYWNEIIAHPKSISIFLQGRSIVGGLLGGSIFVIISKKIFNIKTKMGNQLAIPIVVGMAIGRIGCLLRGCCYGKPTNLFWGVNFGDNVLRHPTQMYEILFDICLGIYLYRKKKKEVKPGVLYKIFLNCYLSFRFLLEFIRVEKIIFLGLTSFQILCIIGLVFINRNEILIVLKKHKNNYNTLKPFERSEK